MKPLSETHPLLKPLKYGMMYLPVPGGTSNWWNFGSLLIVCLMMQVITGLLLSMHYSNNSLLAFASVSHISRDVSYGWLARMTHANGASLFFISLYLHIGRGLYYGTYNNKELWGAGVILLFLVMASAFLGYVLPWGQMSFWGATVITNLFSAIPWIGPAVVEWMWGGFAVDNPTLNRFFSLHFLLPFLALAVVMLHIFFLHSKGSSNSLGTSPSYDKIYFHPYLSWKDMWGVLYASLALFYIVFFEPWALGDPENFLLANPLVTPIHIQPEWYFLFAYAILRSIPNKLGGVVALLLSVMILFILPFMPKPSFKALTFKPLKKLFFWSLVGIVLLLTWIGARAVEDPYIMIGQVLTSLYFLMYFVLF